jgi:hypothetical protein
VVMTEGIKRAGIASWETKKMSCNAGWACILKK